MLKQELGNKLKLQAALAIRGFAIRGFDYSRTRKQGKTANSEGKIQFKANFILKSGFCYSRTIISQERNPPRIARETCILILFQTFD